MNEEITKKIRINVTEEEVNRYLESKNVRDFIQKIMEEICLARPEDVPSFIVEFLFLNYPIEEKYRPVQRRPLLYTNPIPRILKNQKKFLSFSKDEQKREALQTTVDTSRSVFKSPFQIKSNLESSFESSIWERSVSPKRRIIPEKKSEESPRLQKLPNREPIRSTPIRKESPIRRVSPFRSREVRQVKEMKEVKEVRPLVKMKPPTTIIHSNTLKKPIAVIESSPVQRRESPNRKKETPRRTIQTKNPLDSISRNNESLIDPAIQEISRKQSPTRINKSPFKEHSPRFISPKNTPSTTKLDTQSSKKKISSERVAILSNYLKSKSNPILDKNQKADSHSMSYPTFSKLSKNPITRPKTAVTRDKKDKYSITRPQTATSYIPPKMSQTKKTQRPSIFQSNTKHTSVSLPASEKLNRKSILLSEHNYY